MCCFSCGTSLATRLTQRCSSLSVMRRVYYFLHRNYMHAPKRTHLDGAKVTDLHVVGAVFYELFGQERRPAAPTEQGRTRKNRI